MSERTPLSKRQRLSEPVLGSGTGITGSPRRSPNRASYLSPTRASLARYNPSLLPKSPIKDIPVLQPTSGNAPLSNGQNALEYVLGRAPAAPQVESAPLRSPQELENGSAAKQRDQRLSSSATPGKRLQRVVDKVIEDVEQTRTPEMPSRFTGHLLTDEDEDELPETPSAARYSPPKGILSSGSRRKRRRSPDPIVEVENLPVRERTPPDEPNTPVKESIEIKAKREELISLRAQLQALQKDCIDLERNFGTMDASDKYGETGLNIEADEILRLLNLGKKPASTKPAPPTISQQLAAFLPFSLPVFDQTDSGSVPEGDKAIASCAPLPHDSVDDLLTHLRRFTPLTITSSIHTFTADGPAPIDRHDGPTLHSPVTQQHDITFRGPENDFKAKISFCIATPVTSTEDSPSTPTVTSVAVPLPELSDWARAELGSWLVERAAEQDIATLGYGIGAYHKLALKRARCWARCAAAFPALCAGGIAHDAGYRAFLGRTFADFSDGDVLLRVWWRAGFDETGAAESKVYVDAVFLNAWKLEATDDGAAPAAIGSCFDSLLKAGHDVFDAIEKTVRLAFDGSDQKAGK